MRKNRFSKFQTLETIENFAKFYMSAIKRYKKLWGVKDRAQSGRLKSVRAETAIKTVGERIGRNQLWKQIMS
jgi:hypothetical protein